MSEPGDGVYKEAAAQPVPVVSEAEQSAHVEGCNDASLDVPIQPMELTLAALNNAVAESHGRLAALETGMEGISKQIGLLPPQVRALSARVASLATSVSEPRIRSLLLGLVGIYDLVEQAAASPQTDALHRRNYDVLRTQIRQLLETNGLTEIPAEGRFDPQLHRALEQVPLTNPEGSDQVVRVLRAGFRTEHAVLRYAEVAVGAYEPPSPPVATTTPDAGHSQ